MRHAHDFRKGGLKFFSICQLIREFLSFNEVHTCIGTSIKPQISLTFWSSYITISKLLTGVNGRKYVKIAFYVNDRQQVTSIRCHVTVAPKMIPILLRVDPVLPVSFGVS